jgi:hypothetical protein
MTRKQFVFYHLHLFMAVLVIIPVALLYGLHPESFWKTILGIDLSAIDLQNIFKAIMGLYLAFAVVWMMGMVQKSWWFAASISLAFFMGGLATGRGISMLTDGVPSNFYLIGFFLELLLCLLSIFVMLWRKRMQGGTALYP